MKRLILILALLAPACAHPPPTASPVAAADFRNTQVIQGLDQLRDIAINANAQNPPLLSTATTRKVVQAHEAALNTIHAMASGWQATVLAGLDGVVVTLTPAEQAILAPYIALVKTIIQGTL